MISLYPLSQWRWIVVNSSGGKDSQTALRRVIVMANLQGVDRSRIVVSHQCLGPMEWDGTLDLVREQAAHYKLRLEISAYRDRNGNHPTLLDYVRKRRMWPSSQQRFCTSEFKRGPGGRVIVKLFRESSGPILNVYGFRADESTARAKKNQFIRNARFSSGVREVWDWLPIHTWSERDVWQSIEASGIRSHDAYRLGMPRLSCRFCIFAPRDALIIAGRANPELLDEYCAVEAEIGHDFQHGKPISKIRDAIRSGEKPSKFGGAAWNM